MSAPADSAVAGTGPIRLARYLAASGVASRRACEELIRAGLVSVNGVLASTPAVNVTPGQDTVLCRGQRVSLQAAVCLVLNKPPGYTCSALDRHADRLVFELIPPRFGRLFTVGRLDRNSEGLIVLTNDGALAQHLSHPSRGVRKTYEVDVQGGLDTAILASLRQGVHDAGEFLRPLAVDVLRDTGGGGCLRFVLQEGRNREIRRLCASVGLTVRRLRRVAFGPLALGALALGAWRELTAAETAALGRPSPAAPPPRG